MDKKELTRIILTIFVAIIFIASYASFSSNNSGTQTSQATTSIAPQTVYGAGNANASVVGYGQVMSVLIACANSAQSSAIAYNVSLQLSKLSANNSISNSYSINQSAFSIFTGKLNLYQLAGYFTSHASNATKSCLTYKGQSILQLPANVTLSVSNQNVPLYIASNKRNYTLNTRIAPIGAKIPLRVSALLTYNGTVFGNLSVTYLGG